MFKRIVLWLLGLLVVAVVAGFAMAWRPSIDPIPKPAATSFAPALVQQGEALAGAGYCSTCHTKPGGASNAGGLSMETPFGVIYSSNITSDPATGIGAWSEDAFRRAMQKGVARNGQHLFPVFPYEHFNQVTDGDIKAIYAYLMTRPPVVADTPKPGIPFPLNIRSLQAGWKLLFFREKAFGPVTGGTPEWNRGAYLAEGLSHCSSCHSPRGTLGQELMGDARYTGAPIDHWYAPPLTAANPAPVPWSTDELYGYLRDGATALHGTAAGPMSPVVHAGLAKLPDSDVRAIAVYMASRNGSAKRPTGDAATAVTAALAASKIGIQQTAQPGQSIYAATCASCHYSAGAPTVLRPDLALNTALNATDPSTLIEVILHGVNVPDGLPGVMMPGFSQTLSDGQVAELATYLRATRTRQPAWTGLEAKVAELRKATQPMDVR